MILPVLLNTSHRILLSHLCLSVLFSTLSAPVLMASKDAMSTENDEERPKTQEIKASLASISTNLPIKNEIEERVWIPEMVSHFFDSLSFKDIRAGRCVSKSWQQMLTGDEFCNYWGRHFSPSTPKAMGMLPQEFIRYWSTPSLQFFTKNIRYHAMSADGAIIVGLAKDPENDHSAVQWVGGTPQPLPYLNNGTCAEANGVNNDGSIIVGVEKDGSDNNKRTAVQWISGNIIPLPYLNNGTCAEARGISGDGSIIVGIATDGSDHNKMTTVQWVGGQIIPLPFLNNRDYASACGVSGDGSVIVGTAADGSDHKTTAVQWRNGQITYLPNLNGGVFAEATDVNDDGSIIAGVAADGFNNKLNAVQWVDGRIMPLPYLNHGFYACSKGITRDGSIIVGVAADGSNNNLFTAVLWVNGHIISLKKILEEAGVNVEGTHFSSAKAISANGLQVIGESYANGEHCDFKAVLPSKYTQ